MQADKLIETLQNLQPCDTIHIMLEGIDYGEIEAIALKQGKLFACTAHELKRADVERVIYGKTDSEKPERKSTKRD